MITKIQKIITGTPTWVWFAFAYLLYIGIVATKRRVVFLPQLFIIPVIMLGIKYKMLLQAPPSFLIIYIFCYLVAACIGYFIARDEPIKITKGSILVELPGNKQTLILLILFFCVQYIFGYLDSTNPALACDLYILKMAVNGTIPGYFLGKTVNYTQRFINA